MYCTKAISVGQFSLQFEDGGITLSPKWYRAGMPRFSVYRREKPRTVSSFSPWDGDTRSFWTDVRDPHGNIHQLAGATSQRARRSDLCRLDDLYRPLIRRWLLRDPMLRDESEDLVQEVMEFSSANCPVFNGTGPVLSAVGCVKSRSTACSRTSVPAGIGPGFSARFHRKAPWRSWPIPTVNSAASGRRNTTASSCADSST